MTGTSKPVPKEVKVSRFGCVNCLWSCIECVDGSMYTEGKDDNGKAECANYTYYN